MQRHDVANAHAQPTGFMQTRSPLCLPFVRLVWLDRWGDEESTSTFCDEFSEWETRRVAGKGCSERNGVVLAPAAEGEDMTVAAVRGGSKLPSGSSRNEVLEDDEALAGVVLETVKQEEPTGAMPPSPPPPPPPSPLKSFDFVLAGDVLYKHCLLEPFLGTVRDMLAPGGRLLLCHVPRAGVTHDIVERTFVEAGFVFNILTWDNKEKETSGGKSRSDEEGGGPKTDARTSSVDETGGSGCDATSVGGVELCVDYARRARLYEFCCVNP